MKALACLLAGIVVFVAFFWLLGFIRCLLEGHPRDLLEPTGEELHEIGGQVKARQYRCGRCGRRVWE